MVQMEHHRYNLERISDEYDPERCRAVISSRGQCNLKQVPGSQYCVCHGGNAAAQAQRDSRIARYQAAKYQVRLDSLTDSNAVKSLRDEVAVVRALVQNHLTFGEANADHLLTYSPVIMRMIRLVETLAVSCAIVENKLKEFMDTGNALDMANDLLVAVRSVSPDSGISALVRDEVSEVMSLMYKSEANKTLSNYQLSVWLEQVTKFATTEKIVSLRNEIGVLRLIVEERLNRCKTAHDLLCESMPICDAIQSIEKLVKSCQKLEDATGLLLDEQKAAAFCDQLITIVGNHIQDSALLERIVNAFIDRNNA